MDFEQQWYLTTSKDVDVTKLSWEEMMYYDKHNIFLYIKFVVEIHKNKLTKRA